MRLRAGVSRWIPRGTHLAAIEHEVQPMGTDEDTRSATNASTEAPADSSTEAAADGSYLPREPRHVVCIAAQLEDEETRRTGVTWDVSSSGVLILTRGRLSLGDPVKLVLHIPEGPAAGLIVTGKVVRAEGLDSRRIGLWSDSIAIAFDTPAKTLEPTVEELSQRQAEMFGHPRLS